LEEKKIILQKYLQQKIEIKKIKIKLEIKTNKRTFYIFELRDEIKKINQFYKRIINKKTTIKILREFFWKKDNLQVFNWKKKLKTTLN